MQAPGLEPVGQVRSGQAELQQTIAVDDAMPRGLEDPFIHPRALN
jgi:hypothetical protein